MSEFPTGTCRSCGRKIIWGTTDDGKRIPLDAVAPVYAAEVTPKGVRIQRKPQGFVSHFATCPNASAHSKKHRLKRPESEADATPSERIDARRSELLDLTAGGEVHP